MPFLAKRQRACRARALPRHRRAAMRSERSCARGASCFARPNCRRQHQNIRSFHQHFRHRYYGDHLRRGSAARRRPRALDPCTTASTNTSDFRINMPLVGIVANTFLASNPVVAFAVAVIILSASDMRLNPGASCLRARPARHCPSSVLWQTPPSLLSLWSLLPSPSSSRAHAICGSVASILSPLSPSPSSSLVQPKLTSACSWFCEREQLAAPTYS